MSKYRIDTLQGDQWQPGNVTFHHDTSLTVLQDIARDFARILKCPVRIVRVHEITETFIESLDVFGQALEAA